MNIKLSNILDKVGKDKILSRKLRATIINNLMIKTSDDRGILQHFDGGVVEYPTRERYLSERGGEVPSAEKYNLAKDHEPVSVEEKKVTKSLSTRYSPDHIGVQSRRISDEETQDPYTNKIYNWAEGFTSDSGDKYDGASVSLQTDVEYNHK